LPAIKKILCPTDFSDASYEGLSYAADLATPGQTELLVAHVEPPAHEVTAYDGSFVGATDVAVIRAHAITTLSEVLEERVPPSINSRPILLTGCIAGEIVRTAEEERADLIVLTTHGAMGWRPGVLGAVAEEVVRTARCPVLTISGPASGIEEEDTPDAELNVDSVLDAEIARTGNRKLLLDSE
jgi:nucleotide-binding universal stress UspA family protein